MAAHSRASIRRHAALAAAVLLAGAVWADLPKRYGATAVRETPARQSNVVEYDRATGTYTEVGRVPLQTGPGSIGFTSQSTKTGTLSDGTALPGHQAYTQRDDSYAGMSLTVPSNNKSFPIPLPVPPQHKVDW